MRIRLHLSYANRPCFRTQIRSMDCRYLLSLVLISSWTVLLQDTRRKPSPMISHVNCGSPVFFCPGPSRTGSNRTTTETSAKAKILEEGPTPYPNISAVHRNLSRFFEVLPAARVLRSYLKPEQMKRGVLLHQNRKSESKIVDPPLASWLVEG